MIYYFSGTGNSKWAAEQLAAKTGETAVNIMTLSAPPSADAQTIGFVFPIHAWGAPEPMLEFARKLTGKPAFAFGVCTCGGEAGAAMEKFRRIFPLDSVYSIVMPNNYVMGSELESEESILRKVRAAKERLDVIA
nr:EFR1 family ferrodoxin [Anaerolineaceae bacterium]